MFRICSSVLTHSARMIMCVSSGLVPTSPVLAPCVTLPVLPACLCPRFLSIGNPISCPKCDPPTHPHTLTHPCCCLCYTLPPPPRKLFPLREHALSRGSISGSGRAGVEGVLRRRRRCRYVGDDGTAGRNRPGRRWRWYDSGGGGDGGNYCAGTSGGGCGTRSNSGGEGALFVLFFLFFVRFDKPRSPRVTVYLLQMSQPLCSIDPLEYNTGPLAQGRFIT